MARNAHSFNYFLKQLPQITSERFEEFAIELFRFQIKNNPVYHKYTRYLGIQPGNITSLHNIPFIPVDFFKRHEIKTGGWNPEMWFTSSGTTGTIPSRHAVRKSADYLENTVRIFTSCYGNPEDYIFFGLLPSYLERKGSSLISMVDHLMKLSGTALGGFFLDDYEGLLSGIGKARKTGRKIMLIGVTFALLDLVQAGAAGLPDVIVMETGGMKGRREEMTREQVHAIIQSGLGVTHVHSEYGMTEMYSQAYSAGEGIFTCSGPMRIILRDPDDPLDVSADRKRGAINVIDLANIHSCAFIATDDLGVLEKNGGFRVLGRLDNSDIRGCNLMVG